jgi:hypothetical protein
VSFYFEVSGPPNQTVPILVTLAAATATDGTPGMLAEATITSQAVVFDLCSSGGFTSRCNNGNLSNQSVSETLHGSASANFVTNMVLNAEVDCSPCTVAGSGSAFIDPLIEIDPSFSLASEYTLVVGPGVDLSPVPAPVIGRSLPVLLVVTGMLFGAKLLDRNKGAALYPHRPRDSHDVKFDQGRGHRCARLP